MLAVESIREQLHKVVAGVVSLDDFEDWLVQASWNMHKHADSAAQQLVGAIELHLADHSDGLVEETDLIESLLSLYVHGCFEQGMQVQMLLDPTLNALTDAESAASDAIATEPDQDSVRSWSFMPGSDSKPTSLTRTSSGKTIVQDVPDLAVA